MKYEVKLRWSDAEGKAIAKWFPIEAKNEEKAKRIVLDAQRASCPNAEVIAVTDVKD